MDVPDAPRGDRFRKVLAETSADASDVASKLGEHIDGFRKPPTGRPEVRSPHPVMENPTPQGVDTGHLLTATLVTGILLGEGLRLGYRKGSELKERWHARNG